LLALQRRHEREHETLQASAAAPMSAELHRALDDQPALELLDFIRHAGNPLDAYHASGFAAPIARAVGKIITTCHATYGSYLQTTAGR